jgi:hypothetical protein
VAGRGGPSDGDGPAAGGSADVGSGVTVTGAGMNSVRSSGRPLLVFSGSGFRSVPEAGGGTDVEGGGGAATGGVVSAGLSGGRLTETVGVVSTATGVAGPEVVRDVAGGGGARTAWTGATLIGVSAGGVGVGAFEAGSAAGGGGGGTEVGPGGEGGGPVSVIGAGGGEAGGVVGGSLGGGGGRVVGGTSGGVDEVIPGTGGTGDGVDVAAGTGAGMAAPLGIAGSSALACMTLLSFFGSFSLSSSIGGRGFSRGSSLLATVGDTAGNGLGSTTGAVRAGVAFALAFGDSPSGFSGGPDTDAGGSSGGSAAWAVGSRIFTANTSATRARNDPDTTRPALFSRVIPSCLLSRSGPAVGGDPAGLEQL